MIGRALFLTRSGDTNWKALRILGGLLLITALVVSVVWGQGQRARNRAHTRELEAAQADGIPGLVVARDEALKLAEEQRLAKEELESRGVETRVVERIRTVSNPINTNLRELLARRESELFEAELDFQRRITAAQAAVTATRPECEGLIRPSDCPSLDDLLGRTKFSFHVTSDEARLESDAGNTFAFGMNSIYEGDCAIDSEGRFTLDATCSHVDDATWRTDVTQLVRAPVPSRPRILGYYGGFQYGISVEEAIACVSEDDDSSDDSDCVASAVDLSRFRVVSGVEWRFKRVALRTGGAFGADFIGLDVGFSFHRER